MKDIAETTEKEKPDTPGKPFNSESKSRAPNSAPKEGKKRQFVDMTLLIRSIQRSEGNPDCFGRAEDHCDRLDCAWRPYCLGEDSDLS
jgi:hypothetical protein